MSVWWFCLLLRADGSSKFNFLVFFQPILPVSTVFKTVFQNFHWKVLLWRKFQLESLRIDENRQKSFEKGKNHGISAKISKIDENWRKLTKIVENCRKMTEIDGNWRKLRKIMKIYVNWPKLTKIDGNQPKSPEKSKEYDKINWIGNCIENWIKNLLGIENLTHPHLVLVKLARHSSSQWC